MSKIRRSVLISPHIAEQVRDAVTWIQENGRPGYTASQLYEGALESRLRYLERKYNRGQRFPPAPGPTIRAGRPPG